MSENLHPLGNSKGLTEDNIIKTLFSNLDYLDYAANQNLDLRIENLREPQILSLSWLVLRVLALYRQSFLHKWLHQSGRCCRFIPSCTEYCSRAVKKYGAWKGMRLTIARLRRCHPQYQGPYIDFP